MDRDAVERIVDTIIAALGRGEAVGPRSLTFLLRCYGSSDRPDIRQALEPALAQALESQALAQTIAERAEWLVLLSDALALSTDDRLYDAATTLVTALRRGWGESLDVAGGAVSVEACLRASRSVEVKAIVPDAIDELERIVAAAYRPGEGVVGQVRAGREDAGRLANHVALASALLTAYDVSGRLPYSMLAEELMQYARRKFWNDDTASFSDADSDPSEMVGLNCEAARVLCWLGALHADQQYRAAAVIRSEATYADDAARILNAHHTASEESGAFVGAYGLALIEWLALQ